MSETTSEGRLYEVEIEWRVMVFAESEQDACIEAMSALRDEDPSDADVCAIPIASKKRLGKWADAVPYGAPDDMTCAQILDGVHTAPLPDAPATLTRETLTAWLDSPLRVSAVLAGDDHGAGWKWWANGPAAVGLRCDDVPEEESARAAKVRGIVEAERPLGADVDVATFDALATMDRGEDRLVAVGSWHLAPLLVRAFVWGPMRASGDTSVRVEWDSFPPDFPRYGGATHGVLFRGSTWCAVVMPVREEKRLGADRVLVRLDADGGRS